MINSTRRIGPTRRSISGIYAFRGGRGIPFESSLERDFLITTGFLADVTDIVSQPVSLPFADQSGREYTYTPDFLVFYRERPPLLVEVKPEKEWKAHWRKWSFKWKTAIRYAGSQGWTFRIYDENRIRNGTLENIRSLAPYKRIREDKNLSSEILRMATPVSSIEDILSSIPGEEEKTMAHIRHLLAVRTLDCHIAKPLARNSAVWRNPYE
jgi:hypothetical protein